MCGRFALYTDPETLARRFLAKAPADMKPHYNIAPTQNIRIVRREDGERRFALARWGLIPHWAKDNWNTWLESDAKDTQALQDLLKPYPAEDMVTWPISTKVNNPRNDSVECLESH